MSQTSIENFDSSRRLIELDGLRVLAFGLLIFYHVGMLYTAGWGWHYKSTYSSEFLANVMLWSNQWRMQLLFFISGAAVAFLLKKYSGWMFVRKRVPLLLIPLIFGMLVWVVPQVYVEANSQHIIDCPNYWHFWYIYLDPHSVEFATHKTIGSMQLTWNHLWFLPYLFAYSLIMWTLKPLLNLQYVQFFFSRLAEKLNLPMLVIFPIAIFYLIGFFLYKDHPTTHNFVDDWFNHARSFFCFLLGFALVKLTALWKSIQSIRWYLLIAALCTFTYCDYLFNGGSIGNTFFVQEINGLLWSANLWLWILAVIAWAQHFFKKSTPLLNYLNKGIFCFYVLHQTLIIVIAYFLVPLKLGPVVEPILIIISVFALCIIFYEVIKRLGFFGMFFGVQK